MREVTIINLFNKQTIEVDKELGLKIEAAWVDGAKTISFDNRTISPAAILSIEHTIKYPMVQAPSKILEAKDERAGFNSPGYLKFQALKKQILGKKFDS